MVGTQRACLVLLLSSAAYAASGSFRITTGSSAKAASKDEVTITAYKVGGGSCEVQKKLDLPAQGAQVTFANPCSFDTKDMEKVRVLATGDDSWLLEKLEVEEGGVFHTWGVQAAGGAVSAWVEEDGLDKHDFHRMCHFGVRIQTTDPVLSANAMSTASFTITFESTSGLVCPAGVVSQPSNGQSFYLDGRCPFCSSDFLQVRVKMNDGSDGWSIALVTLFLGAENQRIVLDTKSGATIRKWNWINTMTEDALWFLPAGTVIAPAAPPSTALGSVRITTSNEADSESAGTFTVKSYALGGSECAMGTVNNPTKLGVTDLPASCSFSISSTDYVRVSAGVVTDPWLIEKLEVYEQVQLAGSVRSAWVQWYVKAASYAPRHWVANEAGKKDVDWYRYSRILFDATAPDTDKDDRTTDTITVVVLSKTNQQCTTTIKPTLRTELIEVRGCDFESRDVKSLQLQNTGSDAWSLITVYLHDRGERRQGFIGGTKPDGLVNDATWLFSDATIAPTPAPATPSPPTPAPPTPAPPTPSPPTPSPPTPAPPTPAPPTPSPPTPAPPTPAPPTSAPPTPSPPTPAPQTTAPSTPSPPTPVPPTPAPPTPAPPTPSPPTPSPPTPAPQTPAPLTSVPSTPSPPTPAPLSPSPPTPSPSTPVPPTPSLPTPSPLTTAPLTPAPGTPVPLAVAPTSAPPTPAPLTPAPQTPAPLTPMPPTPAPLTPVPLTPAPLTSVPPTPAPQTPAPLTPAPLTSTPVTPVPPTPAPLTSVPLTPTPLTSVPSTPAPLTPVPQTPAPLTPAPLTPTPLTSVPPTPAPLTPVPLTPAPVTPVPPTPAPQTPAPLTPVPQTSVPVSPTPLTPAPLTSVPPTPAPLTPVPQTPPPLTPAPLTSVPQTSVPVTPTPLTSVPPTPAPLTPAPLTPAPLTPVPPTSSPLTSAPQTPTPLTGGPPTPSPSTPVPETPAPTTPLPRTLQPATLGPPSVVPPTLPPATGVPATTDTPVTTSEPLGLTRTTTMDRELDGHTTMDTGSSAVAVGAALTAGASAGSAMRLALLGSGCSRAIPKPLNPTGLTIGGNEAAGTVVANAAITAGFGLLCFALLQAALRGGNRVAPKFFEGLDTQGFMRLPSAPLFIFQFFYQGLALAGMSLVLHPGNIGHFCLGFACVLLCIAVPIAVLRAVTTGVPRSAVYARAATRTNPFLVFLLGHGEWVNNYRDTMWVQRYASVLRSYRQGAASFAFVEFCASFALSALKSTSPDTSTGCGHVQVAMGLVFVSLLAIESVIWPHARSRDSTFDIVILGAEASAMFLMAAGYYRDDPDYWTFAIASNLLLFSTFLLLGRVALDLLAEATVLITKRRNNLQDDIWEREDRAAQTSDELTAVTDFTEAAECFPLPQFAAMAPVQEAAVEREGGHAMSLRLSPAQQSRPASLAFADNDSLEGAGGGAGEKDQPYFPRRTPPYHLQWAEPLAVTTPRLFSSSNSVASKSLMARSVSDDALAELRMSSRLRGNPVFKI